VVAHLPEVAERLAIATVVPPSRTGEMSRAHLRLPRARRRRGGAWVTLIVNDACVSSHDLEG
jgi:hypothetical protein